MKKLLFAAMFCLLIFASCKSAINNEETKLSLLDGVSDTDLVTPYTDMSLLENTRSATMSDPDVVNWKVARFFAVMEKVSFEKHYPSWEGAKVSEKPIVIYNPNYNIPMYYEFRVIKAGKELGSITCHATKESSTPVAYVSEMTSKVTAKVAKDIIRDELKLVSVNYPGKFVVEQANVIGIKGLNATESVEFKDAITAEKLDRDNIFIPIKTKEVLENLDDKFLKDVNITEVDKLEIFEKINEEEDEAKEFWEAIDEEKILATPDEEIENSLHYSEHDIHIKHVYEKEKLWEVDKILNDWADKANWKPENGDPNYCHVHELALIVMGLGEKSCFFEGFLTKEEKINEIEKKKNLEKVIPYKTDTDSVRQKKITKIYNRFYKALGISDKAKGYGEFLSILNARGIVRMSKALRDTSDYKLEYRCPRWKTINAHIYDEELPVVSLRVGGWIRYKNLSWHHRTIVGVGQECFEYKRKFFRKKIKSTYKYVNWYKMADNKNDSKNDKHLFWEKDCGSYQIAIGLVKAK